MKTLVPYNTNETKKIPKANNYNHISIFSYNFITLKQTQLFLQIVCQYLSASIFQVRNKCQYLKKILYQFYSLVIYLFSQ